MSAAALAGILGAIGAGPDLAGARCIGQWELFDQTDDPGMTDRARSLCAQCPVLARCRSWSATLSNRELSGTVAGTVRPWDPRSTRSKAVAS